MSTMDGICIYMYITYTYHDMSIIGRWPKNPPANISGELYIGGLPSGPYELTDWLCEKGRFGISVASVGSVVPNVAKC